VQRDRRLARTPPRRFFGNPCYTQIHPTCIPVSGDYQSKLTLMSESLRNDGRCWVPKNAPTPEKHPRQIPEADRDYYLERRYPAFGNLVPRDIASRAAKTACDEGKGVGATGLAVYLDFADAIKRLGKAAVEAATATCSRCTKKSPATTPTKCPCAFTPPCTIPWAALWVDYELMTTYPGFTLPAKPISATTAPTASALRP
jgi:succinate dehydrogenase / fumarate reductase flavoprotein subunit